MIKNQAVGGRSNRALIFLGLFLALVSAVLVVFYLSQASEEGGGGSGGPVEKVVVAKQSITAGTRISDDMVGQKDISADALLQDVFREKEDVVGQVATVPLVAGEQVVPAKVTATGNAIVDVENPPLSLIVPEGMRGVSVQISGGTAASGLIRPGDFVDVILTVEVESETEGQDTGTGAAGEEEDTRSDMFSKTILQNVQVLSIDQSVALTAPADDADGTASEPEEADPEATTATLAVSPAHAEVLNAAETCGSSFGGRLSLALRAFGDDSQLGSRSVWPNDGPAPTCSAVLGLPSLR